MTVESSLLDTDVEIALRKSLRSFLDKHCPTDAVTRMYDGDRSLVDKLWPSMAEGLGLAGLLVPEDEGGAGASAREAAVVMEEIGRRCAPVPFLTSAVLATTALRVAGATAHVRRLAAGETTACLVMPLSAGPSFPGPAVEADGQARLSGRVISVAGALEADFLVVPVAAGDALRLCVLDVTAPGVRIHPVASLDMSRQLADVELIEATAEVVTEGDAAVRSLDTALLLGAALLASEQVGVARWCVETTVSYLSQRRQFGRVVGGYQALKHRIADLWVRIEAAEAAARYAAVTAACGDADAAVAASLGQAYCSDVAVRAAEECIQLHGGIGMTWDYSAHLYLKRAKADQLTFGTAGVHRSRLAELVDLPAFGN
jgi:alkylation response protein AidB-like acyl-CoA dehydrogenase